MLTLTGNNVEDTVPLHTDKIVCRQDRFPELVWALRDGDLQTARCFPAQLFDCDARRNLWSKGAAKRQTAMKRFRSDPLQSCTSGNRPIPLAGSSAHNP